MDWSPYPILALVGPRGAGKTVLLEHAVEEAKRRNIHVGSINRELLAGPQGRIVREVFPHSMIKNAIGTHWGFGSHFAATDGASSSGPNNIVLGSALRAFLAKGPMLLTLDDAQLSEPEGLCKLLGVVQRCIQNKLPLALIITGTPGLSKHLRSCKETFIDIFFHFNTLTHDESRAALEVPARNNGRPIEAAALEGMIDWSGNHPLFVQVVGEQAWQASGARSGNEISVEDARAGLAKAELIRNDFYEKHHQVILDLDLEEKAVQIADLLADDVEARQLDRRRLAIRLEKINGDLDRKRALSIVDALLVKGYIWRNQGVLEPGIPSLFDYVKHKTAIS